MSNIASAKEFWDTTTEQNSVQSTDWMVMLAENRSLRRKALSSPGVLAILNGSGATAKAVVGLGSVNNTSDADKPISTLQQAALDAKLDATAINTLAKLNAILADATLIDTTDARLSDARTPLSHTHPLSAISDASANGRSLVGAADYAAMRTLLNVENGATADQTGSEIKALYEAEADTNAFTDALLTKLGAIESGATADQTGSEIKTLYEGEADTNAFTDALLTKLNAIESGATADQSNAEIETAYNAQVAQVSAGEITAGTATGVRRYSPANIKSFLTQHAVGVNWSEDGTALVPDVAGYALGKAGNEVGGIFTKGPLTFYGTNVSSAITVNGYGDILNLGRTEHVSIGATSNISIRLSTGHMRLGAGSKLSWSDSNDGAVGTLDLNLHRIAANTLGMHNGAAGQALELYNTRTDAANYERGFTRWVGNVFEIGTEAAGTGAQRYIRFKASGTITFEVDHLQTIFYQRLLPATPYDLGRGDKPWKDIYLRPSSSLTPTANGDLVIEATNNTTLTLKLRGSDGTVRSGTVALA